VKEFYIGIMQGRVVPESMDKLQIFPASSWLRESCKIHEIGFNHLELLWDREGTIKKFPRIREIINKSSPIAIPSMCVDIITSLKGSGEVIDELKSISAFFGDEIPSVLVIPLLGDMNMHYGEELKKFMLDISQHAIADKLRSQNVVLSLELEMDANEIVNSFCEVNDPLFAFCLDTGNLWYSSKTPKEDLINLLPFVNHVHIKDKDQNGNNVLLGNGIVNFNYILEKLYKIKYKKLFTLETKYFEHPEMEALSNLKFIKNFPFFK